MLPCAATIDSRDYETFWPYVQTSTIDSTSSIPLIMPTHKEEYFQWEDLVINKKPHKYQLEGYHRALLSNLIICIPTGKGKTLIAALLMTRMKKLNPSKLVAFVVERIPLVFQQAPALAVDTQLSLCKLCSETKTQATINKLFDGVSFDGLVATAGSFLDLIYKKQLKIEQFSLIVVDECHHAVGNHSYYKLLELVRKTPLSFRPRVVGLSASPACSSTVAEAREKISNLCRVFDQAKLYYPDLSMEPTKIEWIAVEISEQQQSSQDNLCRQLAPILRDLLHVTCSRKKISDAEIADSQRWCG